MQGSGTAGAPGAALEYAPVSEPIQDEYSPSFVLPMPARRERDAPWAPTVDASSHTGGAAGVMVEALKHRVSEKRLFEYGLAESLWGLRSADVASRLQRVLEAVEEALGMLRLASSPREVARAHVLMGMVLSGLAGGNRAENLSKAIACYEAALRVYTEEDFPEQWAMTRGRGTARRC